MNDGYSLPSAVQMMISSLHARNEENLKSNSLSNKFQISSELVKFVSFKILKERILRDNGDIIACKLQICILTRKVNEARLRSERERNENEDFRCKANHYV